MQEQRTDFKETFTSIIIAFAMAFLFRGFVVEAFIIPTGSMAPTLRGQHHQFRSNENGYEWVSGPSAEGMSGRSGGRVMGVDVNTGAGGETPFVSRAGDRIFVMKYLYSVYDPARYDVVVFKNPTDPTINFIKRLIGLPNEQIALIDGDVFVRKPQPSDAKDANPWELPGWKVAAKPERAQRSMWQLVFDSQFTPITGTVGNRPWVSPWLGTTGDGNASKAWTFGKDGVYELATADASRLNWDFVKRPIYDFYAYNVMVNAGSPLTYPVSDLRMSLGVRPEKTGGTISATVQSRGQQFRADINGTNVELKMRPIANTEGPADSPWNVLAKSTLDSPLPAGKVTNLEFWHVDQTLQLWVQDKLVARGEYEWTPAQRIAGTMNETIADLMKPGNVLMQEAKYSKAQAWWEFSGSPVKLYRVRMDRDIFYQPGLIGTVGRNGANVPALATHPDSTLTTSPDQFFVCGDNSPSSLDGRLWSSVNPWVKGIEPRVGVVHRDLLIGKAFFVYFPAPQWPFGIPMPDVGQMRWIW
ncbi:MAG: S26 family signal peptidase [Phycisphaerales bacterium]